MSDDQFIVKQRHQRSLLVIQLYTIGALRVNFFFILIIAWK